MLDLKTIFAGYILSNAICAVVIALLWRQNRRSLNGLGFWLADFVLQFTGLVLISLREILPDFFPVIVANTMVIGGTILLYIGLVRFLDTRRPQIHNYIFLALFVSLQVYFLEIHPSLEARNINLSAGLFFICIQSAWLMLRGKKIVSPPERGVGLIFLAYCFVSMVRIMTYVVDSPGENFFAEATAFDAISILTYQMLFIALTFSLVLMVNQKLADEAAASMDMLHNSREILRFSEEKFSKAFHASPDAILISRASDGKIIEVNEGFSRMLGYSHEEALTKHNLMLQLWADPKDWGNVLGLIRENDHVHNCEYGFVTRSDQKLYCLYSGEYINLGGETCILSIVRDITERRLVEAELRESEMKYRLLFETMAQGVVYQDKDGQITFANPAAEKILGLTLAQMQGRASIDSRWNAIHEDGTPFPGETHPAMVALRDGVAVFNVVMGVYNPQTDERHWININATPEFKSGELTPYQVYATFEDITQRMLVEEELRKTNELLHSQLDEIQSLHNALREQALRDPLTGLHNRRYLNETMGREIARAKREKYPISIMIVDVDNFKQFNDTYGHSLGDKVLVAFGKVLHENTRVGDIACRYGGDEFLVVMPGADIVGASQRAEDIRQKFAATPVYYGDSEIFATISIGLSTYPQHGIDSSLFRSADEALYHAKHSGRNRIFIWSEKKMFG